MIEDGESPAAAQLEQVAEVEPEQEAFELSGKAVAAAEGEFQRRRCHGHPGCGALDPAPEGALAERLVAVSRVDGTLQGRLDTVIDGVGHDLQDGGDGGPASP